MKCSIFLFLLFFWLTTSHPSLRIWLIKDLYITEEIEDLHTTTLNQKEAYICTMENTAGSYIFYLLGAQTKPIRKVETANIITTFIKQHYLNFPGINLHIARKTCGSKINSFDDLLIPENVSEKIPRLYKMGDTNIITQIRLNCELVNDVDAYVLHNGYDVTVYYSSLTKKKKINVAKLFAAYIVDFVKREHAVDTSIFELVNRKETSIDISKEFCGKINEIVQSSPESETGSFPESNLEDDEEFKNIWEEVSIFVKDRISWYGTGPYSYTESGNEKYENVVPIFFGPPECTIVRPLPVDSLESVCVFMLVDFGNNEFFIYLGKDGTLNQYKSILTIAEVFLNRKPYLKLMIIADGYPLPPPFMIHVKSELQKY